MTGIEDDIGPGVVQTRLVSPDLPRLAEHPVLVTPLVMARPHPYRLVQVLTDSLYTYIHQKEQDAWDK